MTQDDKSHTESRTYTAKIRLELHSNHGYGVNRKMLRVIKNETEYMLAEEFDIEPEDVRVQKISFRPYSSPDVIAVKLIDVSIRSRPSTMELTIENMLVKELSYERETTSASVISY